MDVLQHGCCCLSAYSYLSATLCSDKKWKMCFFTCDYIDSYDGSSKKNCNKLSAIFFHLAKLLSKYVSDHATFRYIGEIKTRSADLNFMEVGSLSDILACLGEECPRRRQEDPTKDCCQRKVLLLKG